MEPDSKGKGGAIDQLSTRQVTSLVAPTSFKLRAGPRAVRGSGEGGQLAVTGD